MASKHPIFWEIVAFGALLIGLSFIAVPMLDAVLKPTLPQAVTVRLGIVENSGFDPDVIRVKKGEMVKLILIGTDVTHSFSIESLGVNEQIVRPGQQVIVEFIPENKGAFEFKCNVTCSPFHSFMKGKIIVGE